MKKILYNERFILIREGLKKKLDNLEKQYGKISSRNKFDALVIRNYKENLEREMEHVNEILQLCIIYSIQIKINIYKKIKICISLWKFIIT